LCDDVLPGLSTGHPLLGQIRSFICRLADYYDEENAADGLDSSIVLLSVSNFLSHCHVKFTRITDVVCSDNS